MNEKNHVLKFLRQSKERILRDNGDLHDQINQNWSDLKSKDNIFDTEMHIPERKFENNFILCF